MPSASAASRFNSSRSAVSRATSTSIPPSSANCSTSASSVNVRMPTKRYLQQNSRCEIPHASEQASNCSSSSSHFNRFTRSTRSIEFFACFSVFKFCNPNSMGRIHSKLFYDPCTSLVHPNYASCNRYAFSLFLVAFKNAFRIYSALFLTSALLSRRTNVRHIVTVMLPSAARSAAFIAVLGEFSFACALLSAACRLNVDSYGMFGIIDFQSALEDPLLLRSVLRRAFRNSSRTTVATPTANYLCDVTGN